MRLASVLTATACAAFVCCQTTQADETISPKMSCASVREIFDANTPDNQKIRSVVEIIMQELSKLDRKNASKGLPQIFARMSAEGKRSTAAAITVSCDGHPDYSLAQSAASVYEGMYAMGKDLGVNP